MDDTHAAPDPQVEASATGTPPSAEPVEELSPDQEADQSAAPGPIAQAEYTRATQVAAAVRRELGLPKGATQAEVVEAIQLAKAGSAGGDEEEADEEDDPRVVAERERRIAAELRFATAVYGETFTADALELLNAARTSDDLEELIQRVAAFRDDHPSAPAYAPPVPAAEAAPEEPDVPIDLSEGDQASRPRESTPAGRRETGAVTAIRGLFEQAARARQPRP
jgi:hypothetical protein